MKPVEKMTHVELLEAKMRHEKMLSNKVLLQRLPDKGEKVIQTSKKIDEHLLMYEKNSDELSQMFTGMNLSCPRVDVNQMEWTGKVNLDGPANKLEKEIEEDSEETDIVKILRSTNEKSKIIIDERTPPSASLNASTEECGSSQNSFYKHLVDKVEHLNVEDHKFKPFKTLHHEKIPSSNHHPNWENTAATPPVFKYNDGIKPIHLEESLELQIGIEEKLKHLETKRSSGFLKISAIDNVIVHPDENQEIYDDEPEGGGKGVGVIVMSTEEDIQVD